MSRAEVVDAGIAVVHKAGTASIQLSAILEKVIDGEEFVKYIGNASAVPFDDLSDGDAEKALFLSFLQHVQYEKTGQLVYVSDYQGEYNKFSHLAPIADLTQ